MKKFLAALLFVLGSNALAEHQADGSSPAVPSIKPGPGVSYTV
jgi:uncharacterized protein YraI